MGAAWGAVLRLGGAGQTLEREQGLRGAGFGGKRQEQREAGVGRGVSGVSAIAVSAEIQ